MDKVAVVKYDNTLDSLRKAIELSEGFSELKETDKILLKPNILWGGTKNQPPYGVATTSVIVDGVIQLLHERGHRNITIGEGTVINKELGSNTTKAYNWSGIAKVAKKYGVKLVDFNSEPFEEIQFEEIKANVSRIALESDFLLNLPVLKTHRQTKISLGMKNLKGCLALSSKKRFHVHNLHRLIALLNTKVKSSLTLIDGIYALESGPDFLGTPYRKNLIIAGKDAFSCDKVGSAVMGINPDEVEYLREFASIESRSLSLDTVDVVGEKVGDVAQKLEWHIPLESIFRKSGINGITIQDPGESACSGCGIILSAFMAVYCKDNPNITLDGVEICIGNAVKAGTDSKTICLLGKCAISANSDIQDAIKIDGCPPPVLDTVVALMRATLPRRRMAEIMMSRMIKNIGIKLKIYDEVYPIFGHYEAPEFDRSHF